ncbi:unnamed protein product [Tuber aestivum]|uniref:F-box domain-containing protein n=1 Tax=Tuber aestivum TaxID=59557 RepID=A0A292Q2L9_9PEZI|nr:unnamed protein product [Tuber aestivum]
MGSTLPCPHSEESSVPLASNPLSVNSNSPAVGSRRGQSTSDGSIYIPNGCRDIFDQAKEQKCLSYSHKSSSSLGSGGSSYRSVFGSPNSDKVSPVDHTPAPGSQTRRSLTLRQANPIIDHCLTLPDETFVRILSFLDHRSLLAARLTRKSWNDVCVEHKFLKFPPVYRLPVELVQEILGSTSPLSFNASRHVCRAWYLSALEPFLLKQHLEELGFHNAEASVRDSQNSRYLVTRLSRECSLSPDNTKGGGLRNTAILDLSELVAANPANFTVSICGSYALLSEGCVVYVYHLKSTLERWMEYVTSVVCPRRVLAVSMDTSSQRFAIAILLDGRMGIVHDVVEQETKSTYRNICSEEDLPRSVAICPQRRCVAFGCHGGIELHCEYLLSPRYVHQSASASKTSKFLNACIVQQNGLRPRLIMTDNFFLGVDALTGQDLNRWFPLTAPSDFLYFLPPRRGIDSAKKLRLISSAVHPRDMSPLTRRFDVSPDSRALSDTWEPRAGQSDHFQAVPLSDGSHILFIDPESGGLCLGSDAPLGVFPNNSGPTKLLRKIWLIPPGSVVGMMTERERSTNESLGASHDQRIGKTVRPSVYASGASIKHGVRVVAAYDDHVVLFSVPPDIFYSPFGAESTGDQLSIPNQHPTGIHITKAHEPIRITGYYIDSVPGLVDLAVHSGFALAIYAFSASGKVHVYQLKKTDATVNLKDPFKMTATRYGKLAIGRSNGED